MMRRVFNSGVGWYAFLVLCFVVGWFMLDALRALHGTETWHEIEHILTDPAHWVGEAVMDLTFSFLVVYPFAKWRVRVHDRKMHKADA